MSDVPSWAVRGQKVICIRDEFPGCCIVGEDAKLRRGEIYTVHSVGDSPLGNGVHLMEIHRSQSKSFGVPLPYLFGRFRPLITIEDDLAAHFTAFLHQPSSIKEPAL